MLCHLCDNPIRGKKHRVLYRIGEDLIPGNVCERCWNAHDNVAEAIVAKRKAKKTPEIRPCEKCGRTDFNTDQARRGHQGHCQGKNPPPPLEKPKKAKAEAGAEPTKALAPPPPVENKGASGTEEKPVRKRKSRTEMTRSDKARSSRNKGSSFEREVKKELSLWYGEDPKVVASKDSKFQRAPGSGGTSPANWPLDLHVPEDFPWAVECKNREGDAGFNQMERFLANDKYPVVEWFRTAEEELVAARIEKPLLLVFKKKGSPIMVALRRPAMASGEHAVFSYKHATLCGLPFGEITIMGLENLKFWQLETWKGAYALADKASYMPRKWQA